MPDQITTVAQLSGYPLGAVFTDIEGGVWMIDSRNPATGACWMLSPETVRMSAKHVLRKWGPLTPVWRPDQAVGSPKVASKPDSLPTAEAIADALIRYETSGCCQFGRTCGLCDCGRSDQTAEQRREWDEHQLDRARAVLALIPPQRCAPSEDEVARAIVRASGLEWHFNPDDPEDTYRCDARAVLVLLGDQPTVAQAQAEALRQAARDWSDWDGLSAPEEWLARRADAIESGADRW